MKTDFEILSFITTELDSEKRLDKFLSESEKISSRSYAQHLIEQRLVKVDGIYTKASYVLSNNQNVEVQLPVKPNPTGLEPYELKLDICYEDEDLIVINKPSGLVVHPAAGHAQDTLVNALLFHTKNLSMKNEQRPGIVHRIDKETSGLLVVAKNDLTHEHLSLQFKAKTTHRVYIAIATGKFKKNNGTINSYLARHPTDRKRYASLKNVNSEQGKIAITHFSKIVEHSGLTCVKLKLETGRTHQIRVHLSEMGNPILGDTTYGFSVKKYKELQLNRFYLHAAELGFTHPKTNAELLFKVCWPEIDLTKLKSLGFQNDELI